MFLLSKMNREHTESFFMCFIPYTFSLSVGSGETMEELPFSSSSFP